MNSVTQASSTETIDMERQHSMGSPIASYALTERDIIASLYNKTMCNPFDLNMSSDPEGMDIKTLSTVFGGYFKPLHGNPI